MRLVLLLTFLLYNLSEGRVFDACSLARDMSRLLVPRNDIPHLVCIAQYESRYNTQAVNLQNIDGSRDWGLFQINDRWWCDPRDGRQTSNACNVPCGLLITDDITASVRCAQNIIRAQGYSAWVAWVNQCQRGRNLPNVWACM